MFDPIKAISDFVSFPSISTDPSQVEGMKGARDFLGSLLGSLGFDVAILDTPLHPVVLAAREGKPGYPTVVIYGHYDVQPADPIELWTSPPFQAEIREGLLYGRGAVDNKGSLMAHIAAVGRILEEYPDFPVGIKFLVEGEEEIGSPSFAGILDLHKEKLEGDFVLLSDTMSASPDDVVITAGLRGIVCFDIEVIGPRGDLHSGVHGGCFLNPIQALADLCASLHHADGTVNVPGFYDSVVDAEEWEREELARLPLDEAAYREMLGIKNFRNYPGLNPFESIRFAPTLEFNGIGGGYQGDGSKTVIPSRAFVKASCRLVANQDPEEIMDLVEKAVRERAPQEVEVKVIQGHHGEPYLIVPPGKPNSPPNPSAALARAFETAEDKVTELFGKPPLYLREGGSIPIIADLKRVTGMDSLMLGVALADSKMHAPDENLHLGLFEKISQVSQAILESIGEKW